MDLPAPLAVGPGIPLGPVLTAISERLTTGGPPLLPRPVGTEPPEQLTPAERTDPLLAGAAAVLATSGSSGTPRRVALPAASLRASGSATAQRLGGPGQWLLALPAHHVAGFQVLARSAQAGTVPVVLPPGPFTATAFSAASARLDPGVRHYTSLVPTQLSRVLEDPGAAAALASFDAVLIGGAALPDPTREALTAHRVPVVTTYGMTETCGGCVYDGSPLPGMRVALEADGRIRLGGAAVAAGYLGMPELTAQRFVTDEDGVRWFRTDDLGELDPATGRLRVLGRIDDVINTGGLKVAPADVESALLGLPEVRAAVVLGIPDPEWGQRVAAAVVLRDAPPAGAAADADLTAAVRQALRGRLPGHVLPRQVVRVGELPLLASGKPDRVALRALLARGSGRIGGQPRS
ncbi:o-succinylbenzoate--CoA ligase [Ornithinicoccus hortensis]|uniref:O-succinylbenzoic acid--CoA ligase n=1 Tax=Ornithinicoccus hortensis TaxID=82346 RepID=A0A542YVS4_9MICO|nr:o-succinylbenzoate--CoA ligase [Ornithinicoccus hortensis]TQL52181.1 O-succinylbenzoic acid--CoA ligase [Ornithinicoccus hortensis]